MSFDLNAYFSSNKTAGSYPLFPAIVCADGFRMSVQASRSHYCSPREDASPWYAVEVGFPSAREEALMPYAEDAERPTETVYGYVPTATVEKIVEAHGGLAE